MMSNTGNTIDETAAGWVAREDRGGLEQHECQAREAWLAQDVRHRGAYARAHAIHLHLDRARALGSGFRVEDFAPQPEVSPARERAASPRRMARGRGRSFWMGAMAASVVAMVVGVLTLREAPDGGHHVTRLGEVLRLPLQDGSVVTLNSGTEVVVNYTDERREIQLLRGEALFDVAKHKRRPFVVSTGGSEVTAVGTSFTVMRDRNKGVDVTVREGIVRVDDFREQPIQLKANAMAIVRPQEKIAVRPVQPERIERMLAWRDGMIAFNGDTLAQAAEAFARYSDTRIVIDDPLVAQRKVVGLYSASDPAGFARAVALSMGLQVEQTRTGVYLRQAPMN